MVVPRFKAWKIHFLKKTFVRSGVGIAGGQVKGVSGMLFVTRLREFGAVIRGKANLSEWANFRSTRSISGWSAVSGLTRNPFALGRSACGSSSGTTVAVAAGFAPAQDRLRLPRPH